MYKLLIGTYYKTPSVRQPGFLHLLGKGYKASYSYSSRSSEIIYYNRT